MTIQHNTAVLVPQGEMRNRYNTALEIEHLFVDGHTDLTAKVAPNWLGCGTKFWYKRKDIRATEYWLVDAEAAEKQLAFDHDRLARELSASTDEECSPADLPISIKSMTETEMVFSAFQKDWKYSFSGVLSEAEVNQQPAHPAYWRISPNGKTALYTKDFNLWARDIESGEERALTTDGVEHFSYSCQPEARNLCAGLKKAHQTPQASEALWSPDGKRILTYQLDERSVQTIPSISYAPIDGDILPRVVERRFPLAGDKYVPTYRFVILDTETGEETAVDHVPIEDNFIWLCPVSGNRCWWSGDSSKAYFLDMSRGNKSVSVVEVTAETGACRTLFEETTDTFLEIGPHFELPTGLRPLPDSNELIWFSYRSGYMHLYLYDLVTGKLKNPITEGECSVFNILSFDEKAREVFVSIVGRNKDRNFYYQEFACVQIDTGEMTIIASGNYDVNLAGLGEQADGKTISPDRKYFVVSYSRADTPATTELRDRAGDVLMVLEEADLSRLPEEFEWPEPIEVIADDGVTKLYGVIFKPCNFDPTKKYPVLDFGKWNNFGGTGFSRCSFAPLSLNEMALSIAQLGIIVVHVLGRGGGFRDKSHRDYGYDDFWEMGATRDHVAGIKELAATRPYMDLERVGGLDIDHNGPIYGLLDFPEFYKVGITHTIYDPRMIKQGEVFSGITDEKKRREYQTWGDKIHSLKGKLLIITGLQDSWYLPSMTLQFTDALLRANKDFDQYLHPNGGHMIRCLFARRRVMDYLTINLVGGEPPEDFEFVSSLQIFNERFSPWVWPEFTEME